VDLRNIGGELGIGLGSRGEGEGDERRDNRGCQLAAEHNGAAHGTHDAPDLLGVGACLDERGDLLQIWNRQDPD